MKKDFVLLALIIIAVVAFYFISCNSNEEQYNPISIPNSGYAEYIVETEEGLKTDTTRSIVYQVKSHLPKNAHLEDENDFYKVFSSEEKWDSVIFTTVWLLDKADGTVIKVTDPISVIESGRVEVEPRFDELYADEIMPFDDNGNSIMFPYNVRLTNNVRHPWRLSMYCYGFRHEYSTKIVSENDSLFKELYNSSFVCRSKYEDVAFFDEVDYYVDWGNGLVTYVVYDKHMKELRRVVTGLGDSMRKMKEKIGIQPEPLAKGTKVRLGSIGKVWRSHSVCVYNEETGFAENRDIIETKAENGDIISYLADEERFSAIKLPTNDEFVTENSIGFVFLSYKTNKDGKRYSVLRIIDEDGNLRYEIK